MVKAGSKILTPNIPGLLDNLAKGNILTADDVIAKVLDGTYDSDLTGKKCVVIGGGASGLDLVEFYANKGAEVSVVEMTGILGNGIDLVSRVSITNLMREKNVQQMINTKLLEVKAHSFLTDKGELPFDIGCVCLGLKSYNPLAEEMETVSKTVSVGDAKIAPRQIIDGIAEGRQILTSLEMMGFRY